MSPRLDRMSLREIEDAGQRFYEAKGRMNGEDSEPYYCDECFGATSCRCDPDDGIIADPEPRDE